LQSVQRILAKHYVHRKQAELVKSTIKEKGRHKVIDKLQVELNDKGGFYEVEFSNLGLRKVPVADDFVRRYPKLLVGGVWCIVDVCYELAEDPKASPWQVESLKPIQVANVDHDEFLRARSQFTTEEWMDALMQSVGFNPAMFGRRAKLLTLLRLVPFCERNYNLLELVPKGTGKSHVYTEFSPHGMMISGSEITAPKLFVSNSNGKIGLVGYWDCICFDEFAGKDKRVDKTLVDIMKNYMANRTFSRGIEQLTGEASMVFMGNTQKSVPNMMKHSHFFEPLPDKYIDSAFLDRIHGFSPGWEVAPIRHELFTDGYGFIVDYIAEVLKHLRSEDFTGAYKQHFAIVSEVSTRDQTGFEKTFSGLMKLLYPDGNATPAEVEEILVFSMELRRRVRENIVRIDATFNRHDFVYRPVAGGAQVTVLAPEEIQYPAFAGPRNGGGDDLTTAANDEDGVLGTLAPVALEEVPARRLVLPENTKGWSYARLFADVLRGAREVVITDPDVRELHQMKNIMEFLTMVHELVPEGDEAQVRLVTCADDERKAEQEDSLDRIAAAFAGTRVAFSWELSMGTDTTPNITADTGWTIQIDRGLDIFQKFEPGWFSIEQALQESRLCRAVCLQYSCTRNSSTNKPGIAKAVLG
jgi:ATP-dependent Lon protease